jgi:hypothetical protein
MQVNTRKRFPGRWTFWPERRGVFESLLIDAILNHQYLAIASCVPKSDAEQWVLRVGKVSDPNFASSEPEHGSSPSSPTCLECQTPTLPAMVSPRL